MEETVPFKFKGLDARLPGVTFKFDYDARESGKANEEKGVYKS